MTANSIVKFFYEVKAELAKVVWPSLESWIESTIVVLILVVAFAVYLGLLDFGLVKLVQAIIKNYG
jgi:preprotein translocase subunit SecE